MIKKCSVCGKEFQCKSHNSRYCSEECRNAPIYTEEINGEHYGQLTVTGGFRKKSRLYAVCQCSCGNTCTVRYDSLVSRRTTSCGCVNEKNLLKPLDLEGKTNKYGCVAIKRMDKYLDSYYWLCRCSCGKEFVVLAKNFSKVQSCGCAQTLARKNNMKKAQKAFLDGCVDNTSVYCIKPKMMLKNNTSGIRGVCFDRTEQKWQAQIEFKGRNYKLGRYVNKEDAIAVRKEAEEAMFGNFLKWFEDTYPEKWKKIKKTDSFKAAK